MLQTSEVTDRDNTAASGKSVTVQGLYLDREIREYVWRPISRRLGGAVSMTTRCHPGTNCTTFTLLYSTAFVEKRTHAKYQEILNREFPDGSSVTDEMLAKRNIATARDVERSADRFDPIAAQRILEDAMGYFIASMIFRYGDVSQKRVLRAIDPTMAADMSGLSPMVAALEVIAS